MFDSVMVDIESTGTNYERNAIIQISAVKFHYGARTICDDFFDRCLHIHPGREWDLDTRQWWMKQGPVLGQIQARAEDPYTVCRDFQKWLLKDWPDRDEGLQWWSKPTSFDHPFVTSYFRMFGLDMPCHYRFCRDVNSFMAGLTGKIEHPDIPQEPAFEGESHNALFDVLHQIRLVFAMADQSTQGVVLP